MKRSSAIIPLLGSASGFIILMIMVAIAGAMTMMTLM